MFFIRMIVHGPVFCCFLGFDFFLSGMVDPSDFGWVVVPGSSFMVSLP